MLTPIKLRSVIIFSTCFLALTSINPLSAAPKIQHWMTEKGLAVYFVPVPELPMFDLRLTFAGGSAYDSKAGVASLTTRMLDKGAAAMNADAIAEAFESVGAQFSASSARDMTWISLRSLTSDEEKQKALDTWLQIIKDPKFPETAFERLQKQALVGLQAEKQKPGTIASKTFYKALYGDHPYGSPSKGTEESVQDINTKDLQTHFQTYFVAKNGQLAIVGDLSREEAETIGKRLSGVLKAGKKAADLPRVKPLTEAKTIHVPFPSKQAHITMGQIGNKRGDKDYFSLYLGNHGLGGSGFTSRLVKEVRVKRGLSYSVYSYFSPMRELGPYLIGLQTKLEQKDEAIKVIHDVFNEFIEKGPGEEDIKASKTNITGGFPLRTASNSDIIGYIAMIGFYGLPLNYLDTFTDTVNAVTRDDVADAFKRRVDPAKFLTVIVGGEATDNQSGNTADAKKE